ncbi:MAG: hypothetical protein IIX93_04555 [Clostridia bacterium]|nr:hypothetical protein [Clostridia bacterium]
MNMKHLKRVSVMTTSALGAIGVLLVLLETFGVRVFRLFHEAASASVVLLLLLIIILVALAGVCAYSFYLAYFEEKIYKARMVTLQGTKDDVVLVQQDTLDNFIRSIVGKPEGVNELSISSAYSDMALDVTITVTVNMDADIASMTQNMQNAVREQLETVNGIKLSRVAVIISGIVVPENTEGMKMPWADKQEEKADEAIGETAEEKAEEAFEAEETLEAEEVLVASEAADETAETEENEEEVEEVQE